MFWNSSLTTAARLGYRKANILGPIEDWSGVAKPNPTSLIQTRALPIRMSQIAEYAVEVCWGQCTQSGTCLIPVFGGFLEPNCVRHCHILVHDAIQNCPQRSLSQSTFDRPNGGIQFDNQAVQLVETYLPLLRASIYYWT